MNIALAKKLDKARLLAGVPFTINSACRCFKHNLDVNGSYNSSHLDGLAADIKCNSSKDRFTILDSLLAVGFRRIGIYKDFIHVDMDYTKSQNVIWHK